ncbi:hypothetical protein FGK63_14880 [Ruegeria sediminis]|uniref:Uncharacterized protein n=1 Tax=Ruegeria sediminis TaxID=2583820 RepID=A0ABY2WVW3_9RHOB|nr:hypothetical protein [Ruegeria sediminis]TMV06427.1 hypothetical protein FGK63_14880 [Ruegeria sediminis]
MTKPVAEHEIRWWEDVDPDEVPWTVLSETPAMAQVWASLSSQAREELIQAAEALGAARSGLENARRRGRPSYAQRDAVLLLRVENALIEADERGEQLSRYNAALRVIADDPRFFASLKGVTPDRLQRIVGPDTR